MAALQGKGKSSQPKIEFTPAKQSSVAMANASPLAGKNADVNEDGGATTQPILEAIRDLKTDFCSMFDGVLAAIEEVRKEVGECLERVKSAETHITETEDAVVAAPPRMLIMKFMNDRDKMRVLNAVQNKKQIFYKDRAVRFYPHLVAGIHKKHKAFDAVRQKLRNMGIKNGIRFPAKLLLTHNGNTQFFDNPSAVEDLIRHIQEEETHNE